MGASPRPYRRPALLAAVGVPHGARLWALARARRASLALAAAALAVYGLESLAWPLRDGRDSTSYLMYYVDIWHEHPAYPLLMLFRTPLAPLVFGPLLQLGGAALAEVAMAVAYAVSILLYTRAAAAFGRAPAVLTAAALLLLPAYGALFHQVSSDSVFALTAAIWTYVAVRAFRSSTPGWFAGCGVAFALMVLARPGTQLLLVLGAATVFLAGPWRRRLALGAVYVAVGAVLLVGWASYNGLRYGDFTVARSVWFGTPFYRTFVFERIVSPDNGPASRELAAVVQRQLLHEQPYVRQHIDLQRFFTLSSDRMWGDLVILSDQHWGWSSNYAILRRVGIEAVERHPRLYARDVLSAVRSELEAPYTWSASKVVPPPLPAPVHAKPAPPVDDPNDLGGHRWWGSSTPSGRPPPQSRILRQQHEVATLEDDLPDRSGSTGLASFLNGLGRVVPRMWMWLVVGAIWVVVRRCRELLPLAALAVCGLLVLLSTVMAYAPSPEYGIPFDPIFVLVGAVALLGSRGPAWRRPR
jgi:hypothetical protein